MKKMIAILVLLAFASPVRAGLVTDFDPVEKKLIEKKQLEEDMSKDFKKSPAEPATAGKKNEKSGSNWWKWALGVLVVGGIAAAAGGGGGGGGGGGESGTTTATTGGATASW